MSSQTFLTRLLDNAGKQIDFQRWAYKRAQTCVDKHRQLLGDSLYLACVKQYDPAVITVEDSAGRVLDTIAIA